MNKNKLMGWSILGVVGGSIFCAFWKLLESFVFALIASFGVFLIVILIIIATELIESK